MNIGITLSLRSDYESMWINGIKLNVLNLSKTLQQIDNNNVWVLDTGTKVTDLKKVTWNTTEYPIYKWADKYKELDVLIMLGTSLPIELINSIKSELPNMKIIKYQCGNNYVIDMERVIFNTSPDAHPSWDSGHHQTWLIPQQEYQNKDYYQSIYRLNPEDVITVPFVWDPVHLDNEIKSFGKKKSDIDYTPGKRSEKKLSVMEPNMNVVKFSMIPLMMAESVYRKSGNDAFKQIYIGSGNSILKNAYYKRMLTHLDMPHAKPQSKVKFIGRYPVITFLSKETDIVIAHQWENPLNYAYLDAMYFGYPLIHNADFIKDSGYFYEGFKINEGADLLEHVLEHHDNNIEEYKQKNKDVLDRYLTTNKKVVATYKKLLDNLVKPGTHQLGDYDKKTNTLK